MTDMLTELRIKRVEAMRQDPEDETAVRLGMEALRLLDERPPAPTRTQPQASRTQPQASTGTQLSPLTELRMKRVEAMRQNPEDETAVRLGMEALRLLDERPPAPTRTQPQASRTQPQASGTQLSLSDAQELAARRAHDAKLEAKLHGWRPLPVWYAFWAILAGISAIAGLANGQVGVFFIGVVICALCAKYVHYLYNGGRRRVWFVFW